MSFVIRRARVEVGSVCYVGTLSYPNVQSQNKKKDLLDPRFNVTDFVQRRKQLGHPPRGIIVERSGRSLLFVEHRGKVFTSREKFNCRETFYVLVMLESGVNGVRGQGTRGDRNLSNHNFQKGVGMKLAHLLRTKPLVDVVIAVDGVGSNEGVETDGCITEFRY